MSFVFKQTFFFRAFCLGIRFENIIFAVLRKIKMHLSFEIPDINFRSLH